jgi:hypothetical protein
MSSGMDLYPVIRWFIFACAGIGIGIDIVVDIQCVS